MSDYVFGVCSDDYFPSGSVPIPEFNSAVETNYQAAIITKKLFQAAKELKGIENGNIPNALYEEARTPKNGGREAYFLFATEEDGGVRVEAYLSLDDRAWNYVIFAAAGKMQGMISGCISWSVEAQRYINGLNARVN